MENRNTIYEVLMSAEEARTILGADTQRRVRNELVKLSKMIKLKAENQERSLIFKAYEETYEAVFEALRQKGYQIETKTPREEYLFYLLVVERSEI